MFPDWIRFLRTLGLRKILNLFVVQLSYWLSNLSGRPVLWGRPWFVSVETISVCNLRCPQCPTGRGEIRRGNTHMSREQFVAVLDALSSSTLILSLYFQGEPLMQSDFPEWVRLAADRRLYTQTSTNGQCLDEHMAGRLVESGLDRIIISVDGTDAESYQAYRKGGSLEKVFGGIRALREQKRKYGKHHPLIIAQFLVFRHNEHQVAKMQTVARQYGAERVWIKKAQVAYSAEAMDILPENPHYRRYHREEDGQIRLKARLRNRCSRLWHTSVITSDSLVVPCCFDKMAAFPMGSLEEGRTFARIWNGEPYRAFRQRVLHSRPDIGICNNCTEGLTGLYPLRQS